MKVCVLSKNLKLFNLCRDVIRALTREPQGEPYEVVLVDPDQAGDTSQKTDARRVEADLLIWDLDDVTWTNNLPAASAMAEPNETYDQVFVIGRRQAGE